MCGTGCGWEWEHGYVGKVDGSERDMVVIVDNNDFVVVGIVGMGKEMSVGAGNTVAVLRERCIGRIGGV